MIPQVKLIRITTVPLSLDKLIEEQMAFMSKNGFEVVAISSPEKLLIEVGKKEGVRVKGVDMSRKITPLRDFVALFKLILFLKKENPQIVHSHTPKAGILAMLASRIAGVPIRLHTVAGLPLLEEKGLKRKLLNVVEKLTYSCATKVYPNSFGLKKIIIKEKFCKKEKLEVLANGSTNGINTNKFDSSVITEKEKHQLKQTLKINESDFVFVFVGRLVKDKGINELVSAFEGLNNSNPKSKLLLVGPFEHELDPLHKQTLSSINENSNIITVGYQNDIRPYLALSNVLVFPSYREGFPNVVMQAGAMGLSSIVTDINGCNEIIEDHKNGWIIPVKNTQGLRTKMQYVLEHPSEVKNMSHNARAMIKSRYEQKVAWEALLKEYKTLEQTIKKN